MFVLRCICRNPVYQGEKFQTNDIKKAKTYATEEAALAARSSSHWKVVHVTWILKWKWATGNPGDNLLYFQGRPGIGGTWTKKQKNARRFSTRAAARARRREHVWDPRAPGANGDGAIVVRLLKVVS